MRASWLLVRLTRGEVLSPLVVIVLLSESSGHLGGLRAALVGLGIINVLFSPFLLFSETLRFDQPPTEYINY